MLEVKGLSVAYGPHPALDQVALTVAPGEIVVVLGANGAGKSTLLRACAGICEGQVSGAVSLDGTSLRGLSSDEIVERGVALVPEGRGIFGDLTVRENLLLGAYAKRARSEEGPNLDRVMGLFPKLRERAGQVARTMSGGEQQMVAIGRAMMSAPQILMLDEPSLGLSPLLCKELFQNLRSVKGLGIGILLVEQNAKQSLAIADRGYLLENTRITHEDSAARLATDPAVQAAYLGGSSKAAAPPVVRAETRPQPSTQTSAPPQAPPRSNAATAAPLPRRSAEEQIGVSIDDLVSTANRVSAEAPKGPRPATKQAAERLALSRLDVVMKDIEQAARNARAQAATGSAPKAPARPTEGPQAPSAPAAPPVIEVYRRPRVEVYRRRPSGQFERE